MGKEKLILAYSGGLDTSVAIAWLKKDYDVIAVCMDVGEGKDLDFIHDKALTIGAIESYILDVKDEFAEHFVLPALQAHAMYEQKYPLVSALSRPIIAQKLVEMAHQTGATTIAHGCTGKGNDQVRFEVAIAALDPELKVIAPVREWKWHREEEITFAKANGVPIPADLDNPYSIDQNLWGRANECGVLENPWNQAPEEAFGITKSPEEAPDCAEYIDITFQNGKPIAINNQEMTLSDLILSLNEIAGKHGIGRIDHVENRLVGIKSREIYECPAAMVLLAAHKEIEDLTLVREVSHFKPILENELSNLIYNALWFSPATKAIIAYVKETQKVVNGTTKVKLYKGSAQVVARHSSNSLYDENLATYTAADSFDQDAAVGFVKLWGLPTQVNAQVNKG
ncbi:argininosuccinate synthase [Streptococcus agalactiae]|uniref:argininosuccinate synthase n=1 Tax=Streptococcus agalactiae TaxID=1311 RepID=UPI00061CD74A|nr:argininosuccinate synthase [Streptococcus agalactiae]CNB35227.1 argininosuccinate synthase [Streptococcus agalactiae]